MPGLEDGSSRLLVFWPRRCHRISCPPRGSRLQSLTKVSKLRHHSTRLTSVTQNPKRYSRGGLPLGYRVNVTTIPGHGGAGAFGSAWPFGRTDIG